MTYRQQDHVTKDRNLLDDLRHQLPSAVASPQAARVHSHLGARIYFEPKDLAIMNSPNERLNNVCLNGIAATLHTFLDNPTKRQCALFTTFDLPMVRYNASDDDIWRRCHRAEYWSKDVWILPIHRTRPNLHWVLCCIFPHNHELLLFDSLSESSSWKREIKVRSFASEVPDLCYYLLP
jgi:hypothetical protein